MVVEEALDELRAYSKQLDRLERGHGGDVEKDAGSKPLPGIPGAVHTSW